MKKTLALVLAIVMLLGISACASPAPAPAEPSAPAESPSSPAEPTAPAEPSAPAEPAGELPEITFYHGYFQDDWQPAVEMRKIYDEFAAANADKFIFKPVALDTGNEGVYNKCVQEIANGSFPDIVDLAGMNVIPAAASADLIIDLKPYIDEDPDFAAGVGVNAQQNNLDGKIYTVRDQLETIGFWYNEDLFNKAGADTPDKWTSWDDFDKAVDKLIACPDVKTPFSLNQGWPTTILMNGHLLGTQEGRDFINNPLSSFDNAAFKNTIAFLQDSVLKKVDSKYFTAADSESYREDFFNGDSAMLFNGVWEAGNFVPGGALKIDVNNIKPAVFPSSEQGKHAAILSASPGFAIAKNQDQAKIDACVEFVKYMTSEEIATRIFTDCLAMPPSTAIDYALLGDAASDQSVKLLAQACGLAGAADYQSKTAGANWDQDVAGAIEGKYAGLQDGSKSPDDVIAELNQMLQ